jgi:hypothetical protein
MWRATIWAAEIQHNARKQIGSGTLQRKAEDNGDDTRGSEQTLNRNTKT